MNKSWTDAENASLIHQVDILAIKPSSLLIPGRTNKAALVQLYILRREGKIKRYFLKRERPHNTSYTTAKIKLIKKLTAEAGGNRLGPKALAKRQELEGHTASSISKIISNEGFSPEEKRIAYQNRTVLPDSDKRLVAAFVEKTGRYWSTAMLVKKFEKLGVNDIFIYRLKKRLGIVFNHKLSYKKCEAYRFWYNDFRARISTTAITGNTQTYGENREWMVKHQKSLDDLKDKTPKKECSRCGSTWSHVPALFRTVRKLMPNQPERKVYITNVCIGCPRRGWKGR